MAKKTYDLVGWQNESTGNTPVSPDNLKHMDEGIKYLYDEGATSKDIFICGNGQTVEDAPEEAKVVFEKNTINTKASEVINSMSGNQTDLAPSVNTVKKYVNGVVLYEGEETTIENPITLNDDVSNYDEIEIITEKGYSIKSTKVPVSYGKAGVIHGFVTNGTFAQISMRNFTFSGNKLNTNNSGGINLGQTSNTIYTDVEVRVKKVIGYKKEVS
nr:MAG TPA: hypothetical protein [Caudoviricetes sp.]